MAETKDYQGSMIRIITTDIPGGMSVYSGLTKIKGVSWSFSNAICNLLKLDKNKKVQELSEEEKNNITEIIKNIEKIPSFLVNREKDFETGEDKHLNGSNLDLVKSFDIKRLKNIKSYRGFRHMGNLPSRGQRTKANFRKNRAKGAGIKKKK